jgi:hypothetical protein
LIKVMPCSYMLLSGAEGIKLLMSFFWDIQASRDHYCVNPDVSDKPNRDEECEKKVTGSEGGNCKYFSKVHGLYNLQNGSLKASA